VEDAVRAAQRLIDMTLRGKQVSHLFSRKIISLMMQYKTTFIYGMFSALSWDIADP
jgi:hypothetical protein